MKCLKDEKLRPNKKVELSTNYAGLKKGLKGRVKMWTYERYEKNTFYTQCHVEFVLKGKVIEKMIPTRLLNKI